MARAKRSPAQVTLRDDDSRSPYKSSRVNTSRETPRDLRWFLLDRAEEKEIQSRVWTLRQRMRPLQQARRDLYLYLSCLYDDSNVAALTPGSFDSVRFDPSTLSFNVIRQVIDTFVAHMTKDQPLPMPLTMGGNHSQQERAKGLGRWIDGTFEQTEVWKTLPIILRNGGLWGTGLAFNYQRDGIIFHDRVYPWEVDVSAREAMYGKPRTLFLSRYVDRLILGDLFPTKRKEIESAQSSDEYEAMQSTTDDLVLVSEVWRLPAKKGGTGRRVLCTNNALLEDVDYKRDYHPFSKFIVGDPLMGFFGSGLARQIMGLQYSINDMSMVVQERMRLSGGYVVVDDDSELSVEHLDNGSGTVLRKKGGTARPEWVNPQPVHPDLWNFVLALLPKPFEMTGISQWSAQSQVPRGLANASGRSLQHLSDNEDQRNVLSQRRVEEYCIDTAWQQIDLAEEIGSYKSRAVSRSYGRKQLEELDFKEVRLDREAFVLQVFPTSLLPKTPAARIDFVQQLANAGWLSPDEAMMLLDFPDLERVNNLRQAAYNVVQRLIDRMMSAKNPDDPDVYTYPESFMNLELCIVMTQQAYLLGVLDRAPDANLALLRQFIADCRNEKNKADAANAPPPPPMDPGGGAPGMPPTGPMAPAPIEGVPPPPQMSAPQMPPPNVAA